MKVFWVICGGLAMCLLAGVTWAQAPVEAQLLLVKASKTNTPSIDPALRPYERKLQSPGFSQFNTFSLVSRTQVAMTPGQKATGSLPPTQVDLTASTPDENYIPVQVRWYQQATVYINTQVRLQRGRSSPFAVAGPSLPGGGTAILMIEAR